MPTNILTSPILLTLAAFAPPADRDRDGDGLSDFHEIHKHLTDPDKRDTDGDGIPDGDWLERREFQYTLRTVVHVMHPVTIEYLTDDYQDARILDQTADHVELEVIHYPFNTVADAIEADSNWRKTDRDLLRWLEPGPTSDWTPAFRKKILKDLRDAGIDVKKLDDKTAVEKVSRFLMEHAEYHDGFSSFITAFDDKGKPYIPDGLDGGRSREAFEEQWEREVSATGMYEHGQRGSCTSSAIYINGCMRAVGIPTRTVLCIPVIDANDDSEVRMLDRIEHAGVRGQLADAAKRLKGSWASHTFNEVYVGGRWRRLNYDKLGQNTYDRNLFGMITHVATFHDWADAKMHETVGLRTKGDWQGVDVFGGPNPYSTITLRDEFGVHCSMPRPDPIARQAEVKRFFWTDSKELPENIYAGLGPRGRFGLVALVDGVGSFEDYKVFLGSADNRVFLDGGGATLKVGFDPNCFWYDNGAAYIYVPFGPADKNDLREGVRYEVTARNQSNRYKWRVKDGETVVRD